MNIKRIFTGLVLVALALGFIGAPPAKAADKIRIISGELCVTDTTSGNVRFDGKTWTLDEEGWKKKCAALANAGANTVRILPYGVWDPRPYGKRSQFCPWVLEGDTWDLSKFNSWYFPLVRRIVEIVNAYGMEAWFAWFDSCQLQPGTWTAMSPWKHNLQGVATFYDVKADPYSKAWVRKLVKELAGTRVMWPWGNELDQAQYPDWARRVIFPLVKELGIPFNRMTFGATMSERPYLGQGQFSDQPATYQDIARRYFGEAFPPESNKFLVFREVHKCGTIAEDSFTPYGHRPAQAAAWWGSRPVGPFILSDDGVKENWPSVDGGRPDAKKWKAMATWALQYKNLGGLEHLAEGSTLEYQAGVVAAIGAAYHAKFEAWPENTGKWKYEPPPPPEFIEVTICKTSGLIANPYCPEPYLQKYVKGTEPTAVCAIHAKPEDPPPPVVKKCSCWGWFLKGDFRRWWNCLFRGGEKWCK